MKAFLPCLALSLAVVFCGLAFVLRPLPRRILKPLRATEGPAAPVFVPPAVLPDTAPKPEPAPVPLAPRPDAPLVTNDPARGTLVFRLIDAGTNQPMRHSECEFWCCFRETGKIVPPECGQFLRKTDGDGLITLSVDTTDPLSDESSDSSREFDLTVPLPDMAWLPWLIARGYEPADSLEEFSAAVTQMESMSSSKPVDVLMRRAPAMHGRVVDSNGNTVEGVKVYLWPKQDTDATPTLSQSLLKLRGLELGVVGQDGSYYYEAEALCARIPVTVQAPATLPDGDYMPPATCWSATTGPSGAFKIDELYGEAFELTAFAPGFSISRNVTRAEATQQVTLVADSIGNAALDLEIRWLDDQIPEDLGYTLRLYAAGSEDFYDELTERWVNLKTGGTRSTKVHFACLKPGSYDIRMCEDGWS